MSELDPSPTGNSSVPPSQPTPVPNPTPVAPPTAPIPIEPSRTSSVPDPIPAVPVSPPVVPPPADPGSRPVSNTPRRRPGWILWLVIGCLLVVLVGILWWFGLGFGPPQSASTAAKKAGHAVDRQSSFTAEISGTLGLEINRLSQSGGNTITEGFTDGPIIYTFPVDLSASRASSRETELAGTIDLSDASEALSGVLPSSATLQARYLEGTSYLNAPLFGLLFEDVPSSAWIQTELLADPTTLPTTTLFPTTTIARADRLGIEQLGPKMTAHYRYEVDRVDDALRLLGLHLPEGMGAADEAVIELWIDVWSHLPYQMLVQGELAFPDYHINLDLMAQFHSYGEVVSIETPAASAVIELTPALMDLDAIATQLALRARDKQRKTDLIEIHQALKRYTNDHGSYPSTAGGTEKTTDEGSVLTALVTEGYLAALASDPRDPDFWYGYTSTDGATYELWSVLEYQKDDDAVARGDYLLYLLTPESVVVTSTDESAEDQTPSPEAEILPTDDTSTNDPADAPRLPVK